ncbi:ferredoxin [Arthrobacter sp. MYb227]|uniref:2Fe-2S iron-sulfur cluster-binding protein n=1 Tax=Arthrobacter sp. MYb227 TaxID=1848601 RepID=UPI000CFC142C|nr:2Fe-2S iron-sulfur cluster-binding protein [Arthrobacter sp. MYb227]PQZ94841.1 ferredoxin [Arthrobacter sp. MYb227]
MPTIIFTQASGEMTNLSVPEGTSLMRAAVTNGIEGIVGECGGQAMCATCHVFVRPEFAAQLPPLSEDEDEMLDCTTAERTETSRLGCQIKMSAALDHIVVDVPADGF